MGIEYHRQRFSAALRMPEHTTLAIRFSGNLGLFDSFSHCKILVVPSQNFNRLLPITGKQDEIFQNIQQPCFLEHSLIEGIKLRIRSVFIITVFCFPFHKTVKSRSNCSRLVARKVTDYANCIIIEHRRNVLHVVPNLVVCVFCTHFVLGRTFQFHQNQRQAIDKQNNIRAAVVSIFHEGILIDHIEIVLCCVCVIDQPHHRRPFLAIDRILDRDAVLQIVHKDNILLQQASGIKIIQFQNRFINRRCREVKVQPHQTIPQNIIQQRAAVIRPVHIGSINMGVAHILEQFYDGLFKGIFGK